MIKYLVMGIKKLINKGTCFDCGISLIVPSWKWCELHDPQRRKKLSVKKTTTYAYRNFVFRCDKQKALESDVLIYDENMHIIGYQK